MGATMRTRFSALTVAAAVAGLGAAVAGAEPGSGAGTCTIEPYNYEVVASEVHREPDGELSGLQITARGTTTLSGLDCPRAGERLTLRESHMIKTATRFDPYKNIIGRYEGVLVGESADVAASSSSRSATWDGRARGLVEATSPSGWVLRFDVAATGPRGSKLALQQTAVVERDAAGPLVRLSTTSGEITERVAAEPPPA